MSSGGGRFQLRLQVVQVALLGIVLSILLDHSQSQTSTACGSLLGGMGEACVTEAGEDGSCLGPCATATRVFYKQCNQSTLFGASAEFLLGRTDACLVVAGCMDPRYSNYEISTNLHQQAALAIGETVILLMLSLHRY